MRKSLLAVLGVSACGLALGVMSAPAPAANKVNVELTSQWTAIPLPEMPLGITEHEGKLWATGANEMIAVSDDAGRTWTVRNHYKPAEMLFTISFLDDKSAVAFGSGHDFLRSSDGGITWKPDRSVKLAQSFDASTFPSAAIGFAASSHGWGYTHDGGKTWSFHGLPLPPDPKAEPLDPKLPVPAVPLIHSLNRQVIAVAALDSDHAGVLLANESGAQPWAFTNDGGKTWSRTDLFARYHVTGVRTGDGKFWLYGTDETGTPTVLTSTKDSKWDKNPPLPAAYSDCTAQGCRVPSGFVQLDQAATLLWELPAEPAGVSPTRWAAGKDSLCEVANGKLQCTLLKSTWTAEANPQIRVPVDYRDLKAEKWAPIDEPSVTYDSTAYDTHEGTTLVRMVIGPDGKPESVQLVGAEWADMAKNVVDELKTWRFAPVVVNGKAVEAETTLPYVYVAPPARFHPGGPVSQDNTGGTKCCAQE